MNKLSLLFAAISSTALALPPVHPVLPPVEYIDTETTTNVPFMAWQEHVGKFKFSLTCRTTATNNVQFAFGRDADDDGALVVTGCEKKPSQMAGGGRVQTPQSEGIPAETSQRAQVEEVLVRDIRTVPIARRYAAVAQKADDLWSFLRNFPSNDMDYVILVAARFQRELEQELQGVEIPRKTVDLGPQHISKDGTHYYMATREVAREASREARSISDAKVYRTQVMHFMSHYPNRFDSPTLKARYAKLPPEKKVKLMEKIIEVLGRSPRWDADNN